MGASSNALIKIGMLRNRGDAMNMYTVFLHQHPEVIITVSAYNADHFLAQVNQPSDLDIILVCEHPLDGTNQSPLLTLHQKLPHATIIYFSAKQNVKYMLWAIQSGAGGYIPSGIMPKFFIREFDNFIRHGGLMIPPLCLLQIQLYYFPPGFEDYSIYNLTKTEIGIIEQINEGSSLSDIAFSRKKDVSLIHKHLKHILNKVNLKDTISII